MSKPKHVAPLYPWCQTVLATKPPMKAVAPARHAHAQHPLGSLAPVGLPKKTEMTSAPTTLRRQFHARKTSPPKTAGLPESR
ncbi:hypothetical protein ACHHYP_06185 [Achlya hypogyna]|uniref:Uncharacterized protein n=1 Tax=Achlya hypogyna TaxID=1202772 RepID=A0A1V9YV90_ACHHY|nr:hypothetical protein ACHHYP_06185 [Achlya hypogyna]